MSNSDHISLSIASPEPTAELFLINGRYERIASGVGSLDVDVAPGIYKVRTRAGRTHHDQLIEVTPGRAHQSLNVEPVRFDTTAPLAGTQNASPEHQEIAARESREVHRQAGAGSQLFVVARDLTPGEGPPAWDGVSIHDEAGALVADLGDGFADADADIAAVNVELDPGTYRVRVETGRYGVYEMFAVAAEGWQTQVFGRSVDFEHPEGTARRFELKSASVFMSRVGAGFTPDANHVRLVDQARQGLSTGRDLVSHSDLGVMLRGKFRDPMLGIYGLHLLLAADRPDSGLIDEVCDNLQLMLGRHPDVDVARLRSRSVAAREAGDLAFPTPPMLRNSWNLLSRYSHRRKSIVPPGSLTDSVSDGLLDLGPWLLQRLSGEPDGGRGAPAPTAPAVPVRHAERMIKSLIELSTTEGGRATLHEALSGESLSGLEQRIVGASLSSGSLAGLVGEDPDHALTAPSAEQVMRSLEVPTGSVARSTGSLVDKLDLKSAGYDEGI